MKGTNGGRVTQMVWDFNKALEKLGGRDGRGGKDGKGSREDPGGGGELDAGIPGCGSGGDNRDRKEV